MDRHESPDIEFSSPSLSSVLKGADLLTPLVRTAYELSQRFNGNLELHSREPGQSFNPRIARITELAIQGGLRREVQVAGAILGCSPVMNEELMTVQKSVPVQVSEGFLAAWSWAGESLGVPESALNQAIWTDTVRRLHLVPLDRRVELIAAATPYVTAAAKSACPLAPILIKAFSRYKTL